jgi:predicted PurR-regulated permease PerM
LSITGAQQQEGKPRWITRRLSDVHGILLGKQAAQTASDLKENVEVLTGSIKTGAVAQIIVALAAAIGLIYFLKTVLVTILLSALLAFILDPLVVILARWHIPRWLGSVVALLLMLALAGGITLFFYSRAIDFLEEVPRYSSTIRGSVGRLQNEADKLENATRVIVQQPNSKTPPVPVQVQEAPTLTRLISAGANQFGELALAASFAPFLIYFMLTWKAHVHAATLHILPREHRPTGYRTIARISEMVRAFIVGNLIVGSLNAVACTVIFWILGLPYFYFVGSISAFVGLIPYLGIFGALLAPIAIAMGTLTKTRLIGVVLSVLVLHMVSMNALYPRVIGRRLRLNPLAVALSLLFWAWIWGAAGLILAVPLVATTKIICDFVEPLQGLAEWLGD